MRHRGRRAELVARLAHLEQRIDDVEDSVDLALAPDLLDDLAQRVGELSLTVPTQEDLLDLRLHTARVATELARLAAEVHSSLDRLAAKAGDDVAAVAARVEALQAAVTELTDDAPAEQRPFLRRA
ncbi:MAG: hypothetical protein M3503_06105 [Actinomycetota bacterium]|nr:hypothetical protein [Actinomycetota bacterium]